MNIKDTLEVFTYPFVQRAFIVGVMISLCAALLGVILVLKRYSLIGHGLADVGFASLSLAVLLGLPPLSVSLPLVIVASFFIMSVSQRKEISGDVAIGMMATGSLAFGVIATSFSRGANKDVFDYMFGSILAMNDQDVVLSLVLSAVVMILFILFYNRLFFITYDENYAKASGINVSFYQFLISFLTALTVVLGMRMMGTLLISSLIIFPAMTARRMFKSFKFLVIFSAVISVVCYVFGIVISFLLELPTGASVAAVNVVLLLVVSLLTGKRTG